ncbi:Fc.00g078370.m01.CDS01 [Cosmosporella sp. VM-42]
MSGFEVIGVVLGVLPLAIKAMKEYKALLPRPAERDLKALIRDLETEQVCLRNTCELLLEGIAPFSSIDNLIKSPFGPGWKQYSSQIRLRLWTTSTTCEEQVIGMEKAVQELREKLCIHLDGKARLTDRYAILQEIRRGASFTLRKNDYESIISRIKTGNAILRDLATQNCGLEPSRRLRSKERVIKLIRGLTQSIFNALKGAATCHCVNPHDVCLELVHRNPILVPSDPEDEAAKDFKFHVVFGSYGNSTSGTNTKPDGNTPPPARWDSFHVQLAEFDSKPLTLPPSSIPTPSTSQKQPRRVRWSPSLSLKPIKGTGLSTTQTLVEESKSLGAMPTTNLVYPPSTVSNLCQAVLSWNSKSATGCYGYIGDVHRKFGLYPRQCHIELQTRVTLRQMLQKEKLDIPFSEKLGVALAISVSVLHLHKTSWLSQVLSLDDIVFLREDNCILPSQADPQYRPFIVRSLLDESKNSAERLKSSQGSMVSRPINLTVLSLGALLIQLIIGKVIDDLDMTGVTDMNSVLAKNEIGSQLRGSILESGSGNYSAAVKWCFDSVLSIAGLDNVDFCQTLYAEVIARLEEDIKIATSN